MRLLWCGFYECAASGRQAIDTSVPPSVYDWLFFLGRSDLFQNVIEGTGWGRIILLMVYCQVFLRGWGCECVCVGGGLFLFCFVFFKQI